MFLDFDSYYDFNDVWKNYTFHKLWLNSEGFILSRFSIDFDFLWILLIHICWQRIKIFTLKKNVSVLVLIIFVPNFCD